MPTIQQLVRSARQKMTNKTKAPALKSCPQRRAFCTVFITNQKTELSSTQSWRVRNNRVCRNCYIPGIGHNLRKHWLS
jgi:small subunit ribosomal protein S12